MTKTIKTLDATRFAFTTSFPKVALATVTIEPTATPEEQIVIEGRQLYAYNAPKRLAMAPSGALTVQDKETNYRLISGGFDSQQMYYVYFRLDGQAEGRAVFLQLSVYEYKAFNAAKITVALDTVKLPGAKAAPATEAPTEPVTEAPATEPVTEAPATEPVTEPVTPTLTRKQRAALKHAVAA
jgi:cell division protein FtsN